jgi:hypothetical protein
VRLFRRQIRVRALVFAFCCAVPGLYSVAQNNPAATQNNPSIREADSAGSRPASPPAAPGTTTSETVVKGPDRRIPRYKERANAAVQGLVSTVDGRSLAGVTVSFRNEATGEAKHSLTSGDGVFRIGDLPAGSYQLQLAVPGYDPFARENIKLDTSEVLSLEIHLREDASKPTTVGPLGRAGLAGAVPANAGQTEAEEQDSYREIRRRPVEVAVQTDSPARETSEDKTIQRVPFRWDIDAPAYRRYNRSGEYQFVDQHWYDPFNRNKLKGDYPIFGNRQFFNFTAQSVTAVEGRTLPTPSLVAARNPGSQEFFGNPRQIFLSQLFRFTGELYRGDTSFRPKDWRIVFTPAFDLNYLAVQERGIVNVNPQRGTDRVDMHVGLQQAFVEFKVKDLSPNFDFFSVRAGIQQFASDFRGFIYTEEQPGLRIFGNLKSDRFEYNAAYFYHLEKDTNSGLNTFTPRDQQVMIGNLYIQDFLTKGYTTQFSYHFNKDDGGLYYNTNGLITRPAPIGLVKVHDIRAHYIGWTGNGHIKRINITHAAYQVLGYDSSNPIASATSVPNGKRVDINAQMGAVELSLDKDWLRLRVSALYSSGDRKPTDGIARGFDAIVESQTFGGGIFSFWNREGIRLTSTAVGLKSPNSFFADLRSSKEEGQANFVNPGLLLYNAGADFDLTPKLRLVINANMLQYVHTEPLQLLLFQNHIHDRIGVDYGAGFIYRPPLSENIIIEGGVAALTPGQGLRDIYTGRTLVSTFALVKFQF